MDADYFTEAGRMRSPHLPIAESVSRGITLGLVECGHQFRWDPWSCAESDVSDIQYNQKSPWQWLWSGCDDGVRFGDSLSRKYIDGAINRGTIRAIVNLHNNGVGRKSIWRMLQVSCKCHGVSGSCSIRTCWRKLSDFRSSGNFLKKRYNKSVRVITGNKENKPVGELRMFIMARVSSKDLAYVDKSPSYCTASTAMGTRGTEGRHCSRPRRGLRVAKSEKVSCRRLCSQCGFVVRKYTVETSSSCNCKFYWCCSVRCKQCNTIVQKYYCHRPQ
ncbi:protein Wnt-8b-like [Gigantopelta aegis]|uniref:protein Wnt-8b-like n=1 Tax=Gigantopelta aegis TaxID=1735272 RepID=UPI001B88858D|nr:protein Wnt-8b-like [Gigantopelta aegis]